MKAPHLALALVFAACLGGCGITGGVNVPSCRQQCSGDLDPAACMARCGACSGECVSRPPEGFVGPTLLWYGQSTDEVPCPGSAPTLVFEGYTDPDLTMGCAPCVCGEPRCVDPDAATTTDPPVDGEEAPTPGNTGNATNDTCEEGGACMRNGEERRLQPSARISRCEATADHLVPRILFSPWLRHGKACGGVIREDTCGDDTSQTCTPEVPADGFAQCIMHLGEGGVNCPTDYPEKLVLYGRRRDERTCTACACGPPTRDACALTPLPFRDATRDDALAFSTAPHADTPPSQVPFEMPRPPEATTPVDDPGSCEPQGGELVGEMKVLDPSTFCCLTRPGKNMSDSPGQAPRTP